MLKDDGSILLFNLINTVIPPPPEFSETRITEDSNTRITEDGNIRITEGI